MSEMVERVARAICSHWVADVDAEWTFYTDQARDAIEAYESALIEPKRPLPATWTDSDGVEHPIEYTSVPYGFWRSLYSAPTEGGER